MPGRRLAQFLERLVDLLGHAAQVGAGNVRRHRYHALHVVAFVLADRRALRDFGDIAQQETLAGVVQHGHVPGLFQRVHPRLGHLHLHLVGHAAVGVGPVIGHHKPAGRSGCHQRPRHVRHLDSHDSRPSPDPPSRPRSDNPAPGQTGGRAGRECRWRAALTCSPKARSAARFWPLIAISIGVGEPRLITRLTMSLGSKEKLTPGIFSAKTLPQPFLEFFDADGCAGLQLHLEHAFLRAAVPEVNEVDRVRRAMHAEEAQRNLRHSAAPPPA